MQFRILDTETSGPNSTPPDMVCEAASVDYDSVTGQLMSPRSGLAHIGIPMPPDAQGIHHISDQELEGKPDISVVFKSVISPFPYPNIVLVAHSDYDQRVLKERLDPQVQWIDTLKAAYRLWPESPNHKNQTLRYFLKLQIPAKMQGGLPHRALPDAVVTALILIEALKLTSAEQLIQWTKEPSAFPRCPIGKKQGQAGKKWADVDEGFLTWMVNEEGMDHDLKWNAQRALAAKSREWCREERDNYMLAIPTVIAQAKNLEDLRQWFADEGPTREKLCITKGTDEFQKIVTLCGAQKQTILAALGVHTVAA